MNNTAAFACLDSILQSRDISLIDSITVLGYASPDGPASANERVAAARAQSVKAYITASYPISPERIKTRSMGENIEGLRILVAADAHMPQQAAVLKMIDNGVRGDMLEARLKAIDNGFVFRYVITKMSKHLRSASVCTVWMRTEPAVQQEAAQELTTQPDVPGQQADSTAVADVAIADCVAVIPETPSPDTLAVAISDDTAISAPDSLPLENAKLRIKYPLLGIKTNALYDLAMMPNLELEYYFADRWSVNGEYQVAWWRFPSSDSFYQIQMGGPELRWWLTPGGKYTGHNFGVYASVGVYDLKKGDTGYQSDGFWSAGVSWNYVMPVKRNFFLEFGIGAGYVHTRYDEYFRNYRLGHHYDYIRTRQTSYLGVTKLKAGLVWRIGKKTKAE